MSPVLRIAARNVVRHKRRALITAITMMAGIGIFIGVDSLMNGMDRMSVDNMIDLRQSSVRIFSKAYFADRKALPLSDGIPDPAALGRAIHSDSRVVGVTRRTQFLAELGNYRDSVPVVGTVIDPATDPSVFTIGEHAQGAYLTPAADGEGPDRRIVIGAKLAEKLGVRIGDVVTVSASTRYGARNADEFTVVGLLSTSDPALNQSTALVSFAAADDFLDLEGLVTEMDVRLARRVNLADMVTDAADSAARIAAADPGLRAFSFAQMEQGFLDILRQKRSGSFIIIVVILLMAAVGIANTVLMSVYERIREVGVLKALGFRSREVAWMFTLEGLFVGLLGSLAGAALGIGIDACLIYIGIPLEAIAGDLSTSGFAFWGTLRGEWNPGAMVFAVAFGLAIALLAALVPARKAGRMTATAALHFV